jgi:hypothetical protein
METLIIILSYIFITHLIAKYIGEKREIGYRNIIIWSLLLSPLIGLLIALSSKNKEEDLS